MSTTALGIVPYAEKRWREDCRNHSLPHNARLVLEALRRTDEPLKAYGLLEQLLDKGISAPMTVYRALDRLIDEGLVRKINALNAFVAVPAPPDEAAAYLVCRQCGKLRVEPLDLSVQAYLTSLGLEPHNTYIEAFYDCRKCLAQVDRPLRDAG
ncbi:transcriptional regulator, Fur family protein [Parvularcula bermudensis HTCC2503]|uniref:Transcriptional regulator, Fur family protein n=1 Tax=Parvularcula bermudensis (strain ATCC BAA-594 / HTCC2503 / KCTC 12087) TaxID=314260 RepID=E0TEK1_PARBH|nr:transcriptional repressor [Parvularcula bermudensis]ADM10473.1 transcriptional regulator, Fur family protein [Parvularcula bermudensis HTCC2503]